MQGLTFWAPAETRAGRWDPGAMQVGLMPLEPRVRSQPPGFLPTASFSPKVALGSALGKVVTDLSEGFVTPRAQALPLTPALSKWGCVGCSSGVVEPWACHSC